MSEYRVLMIDAGRLLGFLDVLEGIDPAWAILHPDEAEAARIAHAGAVQSVRAYVNTLLEPETTFAQIERGEV